MENHIRYWRRERGLSQEALGKLVGLGKPAISKLERGDLRLRDVTIAKLVDALKDLAFFKGKYDPYMLVEDVKAAAEAVNTLYSTASLFIETGSPPPMQQMQATE